MAWKNLKSVRIGVQSAKKVLTILDFVLWLIGFQSFGEPAPERMQASIGHLQNTAEVERLWHDPDKRPLREYLNRDCPRG
jgi:hypothetical protein